MKEHKSHMSMVARFAYIFATIVTIFAQMGLAPLIETRAASDPVVTMKTDKNGYSKGDTMVLTLSSTTTDSIDLAYDTTQLQYVTTTTDSSGSVYTSSTGVSVSPRKANTPVKLVFKVTGNLTASGIPINYSYSYYPLFSIISKTVQLGSIQITSPGNMDTTKVNNPAVTTLGDVKVSVPADAAIKLNPVTNTVTDSTVKVHVEGPSAMTGVTYTQGSTTIPVGTQVTLTWSDTLTPLQSTITDNNKSWETNMNALGFYFTWDLANHKVVVTAGKTIAAGWTMDIPFSMSKDSTSGTVTVIDGNGNPGDTVTTPGPAAVTGVDASNVKFAPMYAKPFVDGNGKSATILSAFPFFYVKNADDPTNPLYAFMTYLNYDSETDPGQSAREVLTLRKGILASTYPNVQAGYSNANGAGTLENFGKIAADGSVVADSVKKLVPGKTYTLNQYNPLSLDPSSSNYTRYKRNTSGFASRNYYMPDGIPTFSVDSNGKVSLGGIDGTDPAAGNSIKGQWSVDSKGNIVNRFFHLKQLRVEDQDGNPISGVTLKMKNVTAGDSIAMGATTGSNGNGDLLPSDFDSTKNGPFYYADGTQQFVSLTGYDTNKYGDYGIDFTGLDLQTDTDQLKLTGNTKYALITDNLTGDGTPGPGQTLTLKLHRYTPEDKNVTIKKVAQADQTKVLGGAKFKIEEIGNTTDPLNVASTDATAATTGLTTNSTIDPKSNTQTRTFHITETKSPDDTSYLIGNTSGYYATWQKGTGFTGVGMTQATATDASSSDKLASVKDGQLVIADPSTQHPGGGDSGMKIQYVDSARYNDATNTAGTTISGSQLPVLDPTATYAGNGIEGFSGLGGIIYNPDTTESFPQTAATMSGSTQKSGTNGIGVIQNLWSTNGLVSNWKDLFTSTNTNTNGYILRNAIATNTIPASPYILYQLYTPAQKARADNATTASGYYNLGSTLVISGNGSVVKVQNAGSNNSAVKANKTYRDNPVQTDNTGNVTKIQLYKVKHVQVIDANGKPQSGVTVTFTGMTAKTAGDDGTGDLIPTDGSFIFPNANQQLQSVTQSNSSSNTDTALVGADGTALNSNNGFSFAIADGKATTDKIYQMSKGNNVSISADGQTVIIKTQPAFPTLKLHKQDFADANTPVANATFTVAPVSDTSATATGTTDSNGDLSTQVTKLDPNNQYVVKETKAPSDYVAAADSTVTLSADGKLSAVSGDADAASVSNNLLTIKDIKRGSGGVGDNGTNGGTLSIKKIDKATQTQLSGAKFQIQEPDVSDTWTTSSTNSKGNETFDLGDPTTKDRYFLIKETTSPSGYVASTNQYGVLIKADGTMSISGPNPTRSTTSSTSSDAVIGFVSNTDHTLTFADDAMTPVQIEKIATNGATLAGATFQVFETDSTGSTSVPNTMQTLDATGSDGLATFTPKLSDSAVHYFRVRESVAPNGYAQVATDKEELIAYQPGQGVIGVKPLGSSAVSNAATSLKVVNNTKVTFTDQVAPVHTYPLQIRRAITVNNTTSMHVVNKAFKVTLQSVDGDKKLNVDVDASGNAEITSTALAVAMGYGTAPTNNTTDTFWLTVDPEDSNYTVPVRRKVQFNWNRANDADGFSIPETHVNDVSTASVDGMVTDDWQDTGANKNQPVGKGGLRMLVRRDTLVARSSTADTKGNYALIPNATFELTYTLNGTLIGTQTATTNEHGVAVLQAPTMAASYTGNFPFNQVMDVSMVQTGSAAGYLDFDKTSHFTYNSASGYTVPTIKNDSDPTSSQAPTQTGVQAQYNPDNGMPDPDSIPDQSTDQYKDTALGFNTTELATGVIGTQYTFGGTQLIVPLTQEAALTLDDVPRVMNFGKAERSTFGQSLGLLSSNDANLADFDTSTLNDADAVKYGTATDDFDDSGNATNNLSATVTQKGFYPSGWRLKMGMSALKSQDKQDTIANSSVSMAAPTVTLTPSSTTADPTGMGIEAPNIYMSDISNEQSLVNAGNSDSVPGTYGISWNLNDIKMQLPPFAGKLNTNYHSTITWDLTTAP